MEQYIVENIQKSALQMFWFGGNGFNMFVRPQE